MRARPTKLPQCMFDQEDHQRARARAAGLRPARAPMRADRPCRRERQRQHMRTREQVREPERDAERDASPRARAPERSRATLRPMRIAAPAAAAAVRSGDAAPAGAAEGEDHQDFGQPFVRRPRSARHGMAERVGARNGAMRRIDSPAARCDQVSPSPTPPARRPGSANRKTATSTTRGPDPSDSESPNVRSGRQSEGRATWPEPAGGAIRRG